MGGKFSIAGTVIGVFTIQTLKSTITFLGVPPAVSPLFLAMVVIIVVLVQSRRVRSAVEGLWRVRTPRARNRCRAPRPTRPTRRRPDEHHDHDSGSGFRRVRRARAAPHQPPHLVDPGARGARHPDRFVRRRPGVLRQLPDPASAVVAVARQRVLADPRGRHDLRHPHRWHRPLGRRGARLHGDPRRQDAQRGSARHPGDPGHAAGRGPDRTADRHPHPVLRRATIHRIASRDVCGARSRVPGQPVVDQDRRPGDPLAADRSCSTSTAGSWLRPASSRSSSSSRQRSCCTSRASVARSTRSAATSSRRD